MSEAAHAGLTQAEAGRRLAARGEPPEPGTSRSTASIVRANVLTPFNAILLVLGVLTLAFADPRDALFLGIIVTNSAIGIWQELRAKRKLDELAALIAPRATVVRDGEPRQVQVEQVVVGDLVRLAAGDQVVADGTLAEATDLSLDESILTGESRPVTRAAGGEVRSGSFAVDGAGAYEVEAVGADSYAGRIAGTAKEFRHPRSPSSARSTACSTSWSRRWCRSGRCSSSLCGNRTSTSRGRWRRRSRAWSRSSPKA